MSEYYFLGYQRRPCQKCSGIMGITEVQSQSAVLWKCANCGYSVINYYTTPMNEDEVQRLRSNQTDGPFTGDEGPVAEVRKARAMQEFYEIMKQGQKKWWQFWK
jgi:DNA-directed RNA polymerase subunit M/transcription elongation factor TFIIS